MFQTEERVNRYLNYSKVLVDQIEKEKGIQYSLKEKSKQYLIFAGMLSYYGFDSASVIYDAFKATTFHITPFSIYDYSAQNYGDVSQEFLEQAKRGMTGVVFNKLYFYNDKFERSYDLFVSTMKHSGPLDVLATSVHEVNHVVNSIRKGNVKIAGKNYVRVGMNVFDDNNSKNEMFEETINELQSTEIVREIINFSYFKIYDPVMASALENIFYARKKEVVPRGYTELVPLIQPLYRDSVLHHVFNEGRMNGEIPFIMSEIDKRAGRGTFHRLSQTLDDMLYNIKPPFGLHNFWLKEREVNELVGKILRK